ncbi:MAG: ABC transporter ATP-binding protein [Fimbriimonadaceae bacterium]|nr:ABC transporter ATP-binding protein [Fimbriimonadaceae bacterium]QYK54996.1 MAG: ABC transporter ATP-binding protein [Fimbriimonadaceae bacterium]
MSVLEVKDACVEFHTAGRVVLAVDRVSLSVDAGETLAVVGESGCGKTTLARAVLGLQPLVRGEIRVQGEPVRGVTRRQAERVGMVWQDPFASLDPRWRIQAAIAEPFRLSGRPPKVEEVMEEVGLDTALVSRFPHELSGGQRQRVAIARALALKPPLVICDEPTAALDLSMQAQILNLLRDLQRTLNCAFLYISHDLSTVRFLADRVAVMYMGQIVESGPIEDVFDRPAHPYTAALLASSPTLETLGKLPAEVAGEVPDPRQLGAGCRFAGRCPRVLDSCRSAGPERQQWTTRLVLCNNPIPQSQTTSSVAGPGVS